MSTAFVSHFVYGEVLDSKKLEKNQLMTNKRPEKSHNSWSTQSKTWLLTAKKVNISAEVDEFLNQNKTISFLLCDNLFNMMMTLIKNVSNSLSVDSFRVIFRCACNKKSHHSSDLFKSWLVTQVRFVKWGHKMSMVIRQTLGVHWNLIQFQNKSVNFWILITN